MTFLFLLSKSTKIQKNLLQKRREFLSHRRASMSNVSTSLQSCIYVHGAYIKCLRQYKLQVYKKDLDVNNFFKIGNSKRLL